MLNQNFDIPLPPEDNSGFNVPDPEEQKSRRPEKNAFAEVMAAIWHFIYEVLKTAAIIVVAAFLIRYFLIQPFVVEGESMEPNFHNNEYLVVQKVTGYLGRFQRGDVIVFKYPNNPEISYIKRIIGLPGERVRFDNGLVTIFNAQNPQGKTLDENYVLSTLDKTELVNEKTLGPNEYYVLGDNRNNSSDSREWGLLEKKFIQGKVLVRLYPFSEIGLFHDPQYAF